MLSPSVPCGQKTTKKTTPETESYWAEFAGRRNDVETLTAKAKTLSSLLVRVSEWNVPFVKEVAPHGRYDDRAAFDESLTVMLYVIDRMASRLLDPARRAQFFGAVLASVVQNVSGDQNEAVSHALNERYSERVARYAKLDLGSGTPQSPSLTDAVGLQFGNCLGVDALGETSVIKRLNVHVADFVAATTECFQLRRLIQDSSEASA